MAERCDPAPDLRGKSLLIVDEGLRSRDGHWFEYDRAVARLHLDAGARVTILAHRDFAAAAELEAEGVSVLPVIPKSWWDGAARAARLPARPSPGYKLVRAWAELSAHVALARKLSAVLAKLVEGAEFDLVFHPSALATDLLAWRLMPSRARGRVGRVVILARFGLGVYGASGGPRFARRLAHWRWIARLLRSEIRSGWLALMTDSDHLAREYQAVSGVRPAVIASPRTMPARAAVSRDRAPITFGTLGAARLDKGIDVFQAAIERLVDEGRAPACRFLIQWSRPVPTKDGAVYPRSARLEASGAVEFIEQALSSEDYERAMARIDCMVLPYRRSAYHSQISGVAVEAACAGIPLIATADTWLSDFLAEQGAGLAVADGDVEGLAAAIREIAAGYPAFRAQAVERSAAARERNSPQRFLRALWGAEAGAS